MVRFGPSRKGTQRGCRFHHEPVQVSSFKFSLRIVDGPNGQIHRVEFNPSEMGSYLIDLRISIYELKIQSNRFVGKGYDSLFIRHGRGRVQRIGRPAVPVLRPRQSGGSMEIFINNGFTGQDLRWGVQHFHDQVQIARGRLAHDQRRLQRPARHGNALCLQTLQSKDHDHSTNGSGSYLFDNEIDQRTNATGIFAIDILKTLDYEMQRSYHL